MSNQNDIKAVGIKTSQVEGDTLLYVGGMTVPAIYRKLLRVCVL